MVPVETAKNIQVVICTQPNQYCGEVGLSILSFWQLDPNQSIKCQLAQSKIEEGKWQ